MKKKTRKSLQLNRETILHLSRLKAAAGGLCENATCDTTTGVDCATQGGTSCGWSQCQGCTSNC